MKTNKNKSKLNLGKLKIATISNPLAIKGGFTTTVTISTIDIDDISRSYRISCDCAV